MNGIVRILLATSALAVAACRVERDAARSGGGGVDGSSAHSRRIADTQPAGSSPLVRGVERGDSAAYGSEEHVFGVRYRVVVTTAAGSDTLPGVWVTDRLVVRGGEYVDGLAVNEHGEETYLFRWSARARKLDSLPLPGDFVPGLTGIELAPDGRHVAYVAFDGNNGARGVVRRWPQGEEVASTPRVEVSSGDDLAGSAGWRSATEFALYIAQPFPSSGWVRFSGRLGTRELRVDTVAAEPAP